MILHRDQEDKDMKHYEAQLGNEEVKFNAFSSADRQTRAHTTGLASHANTTSKKRRHDEISSELSLYEHVRVAQHEQLGQQVHENRMHAELRRVNARDLEMHMRSKAQLFACLSLEGKSSLVPYYLHHLQTAH